MKRRTNFKLQNQPIELSEFVLVIYLAINSMLSNDCFLFLSICFWFISSSLFCFCFHFELIFFLFHWTIVGGESKLIHLDYLQFNSIQFNSIHICFLVLLNCSNFFFFILLKKGVFDELHCFWKWRYYKMNIKWIEQLNK